MVLVMGLTTELIADLSRVDTVALVVAAQCLLKFGTLMSWRTRATLQT